jgi:hypothetical protein
MGERRLPYLGGVCGPKTEPSTALRSCVQCSSPPRHSGNACVPRRPTKELWSWFPPSPLYSHRKLCCLLQKIIKTRRSGYLFNKFYVGLATKALGFCMVVRPKTLLYRSYIYTCVCVCGGGSRGANLVEGTIWSMLANKSLKALSALRLLFLGWNLSSKMSV